MATKAKSKADDMTAEVEVEATGPVKHGVGDETTTYGEGDTFTVTRKQAISLASSGAVVEPGAKKDADTADEDAKKAAAEIETANAQAEADKAAVVAEAAKTA